MAFTGSPTGSLQYDANREAVKSEPQDRSQMRYAYYDYTHSAGAGVGEINLCDLPPGKIKVYPTLSRFVASAMVATADAHVGHRAYTQPDETVVAEDNNEWLDNVDVGGGAVDIAYALPAVPTNYNSVGGVTVYCEIDTANIEDTDTITGWVAYTQA